MRIEARIWTSSVEEVEARTVWITKGVGCFASRIAVFSTLNSIRAQLLLDYYSTIM